MIVAKTINRKDFCSVFHLNPELNVIYSSIISEYLRIFQTFRTNFILTTLATQKNISMFFESAFETLYGFINVSIFYRKQSQ